jgi:hypothetical protein
MENKPFNFDLVTRHDGTVIQHPDDFLGAHARRPSTFANDAFEIITKAPLRDSQWHEHVGMDYGNLYQGTLNATLAAVALRDYPQYGTTGRLRRWKHDNPGAAANRLADRRLLDAQQYAFENLGPKDASRFSTFLVPHLIGNAGLATVIENHLSHPIVSTAAPADTAQLIVAAEMRCQDDPHGNISYVLAHYIPDELQARLELARYNLIDDRTATDLTRLKTTQQVLNYWPSHPYAQFDPKVIVPTRILKYSHLLPAVPHQELAHRQQYEAPIADQLLSYRQQRVRDYFAELSTGKSLLFGATHHISELAQQTHDELQRRFLDRFQYRGALDKILHYQYCIAEPDSKELAVFRAVAEALPGRLFSENLEEDRRAAQAALKLSYNPDKPEDSFISPPVRITLPDEHYRILSKAGL